MYERILGGNKCAVCVREQSKKLENDLLFYLETEQKPDLLLRSVISAMITVAVCTYKRPLLLQKLLSKLNEQLTDGIFEYGAVVVDNDSGRSAESVVENCSREVGYRLRYIHEPEKSITKARNRAVQSVEGEYLAFIDDDEYPNRKWLYNLYTSIQKFGADGVLGPVLPYFEGNPPEWLVRSRLCCRRDFSTGTLLTNPVDTRTGNVLLCVSLFDSQEPFDNRFGSTGGEDSYFFAQAIRGGKRFIWCNEAPVYELVPPSRLTRRYHLQRALLRGTLNARNSRVVSMSTLKSMMAASLYTLALPWLFLAGHHHFMKYLVRNCDHIGKLLGLIGIELVRDRTFQA